MKIIYLNKLKNYLVSVILLSSSFGQTALAQPTIVKKSSLDSPSLKNVFLGQAVGKFGSENYLLHSPGCIDIPNSASISIGTRNTKIDTKLNISTQEVMQSLGADINLNINDQLNSMAAVAKYLHDLEDSEQSFTYSIYAFTSQPVYLNLNNFAQTTSVNSCGDGYVTAATAGIYFVATVKVKFKNELYKQSILANLDGTVKDVGTLSAALEKLSKADKNGWTINLNILQLGGDTTQVFTALNKLSPNQEREIQGLYVSQLNWEKLPNLKIILDSYTQNEIAFNQPKKYLENLTTISQLNDIYLTSQGLIVQKYKNLNSQYSNNDIELLDDVAYTYTNLNKTLVSLNQYKRIVGPYDGSFATPAPGVANMREFIYKSQDMSNTLRVDYQICAANMINSINIENKELTLDCKTELKKDIQQAKLLQTEIINSQFNGGYLLKQNPSEYLLYLGTADNMDKYFLTYSKNVADATYLPFSLYVLNTSRNDLQYELLNDPGIIDTKLPRFYFNLSDVIIYNNLIGFTGVKYSKYPNNEAEAPSTNQQINLSLKYMRNLF